jgi:hypothetical protein
MVGFISPPCSRGELRRTNVRWADLVQNHEGADNEDSSPESVFQRPRIIVELNSSVWPVAGGPVPPLNSRCEAPGLRDVSLLSIPGGSVILLSIDLFLYKLTADYFLDIVFLLAVRSRNDQREFVFWMTVNVRL